MIRLALLLLALAVPASAADVTGLEWQPHPGVTLPMRAELRDASGAPTTLEAVARRRPLILAPGYFKCPNLCGVVRDDLFAALAASKLPPSRYAVALVTIDPAETPADAQAAREAVLGRYPDAEFAVLTGPAASLDAIAGAAGFRARLDPVTKQFIHPAGIAIASPSGEIESYLFGVGYAPEELKAAVAAAEAGQFRPAEPVHLFCFSYDPATGRFTATVMEALRSAAVLTVVAIAVLLLRMARRA